MRFTIRAFILLWLTLLAGCSYFSKPSFIQYRDKHYLTARSIPPLKIPPGLSSDIFHTKYPVSDRPDLAQYQDVSVEPPGLGVTSSR